MDALQMFYEAIEKDMTITLATAEQNSVTMRAVSPVLYGDKVLIFTHASSTKYRQLANNPHCCIGTGMFFAQARAEILGATMSDANKPLRDAYSAKFADAFAEGVAFGGREAEFILLTITRLNGWASDDSTGEYAPFEIKLT